MPSEQFSFEAAIIAVTIVFLILGAFIVMIMLVYRKRRNSHIIEKISIESNFRQELLKAQIEMQEQTLNYISREIHDNITQVLSFVKLNLGLINNVDAGTVKKISDNRELISQSINDLRNLSKSLSFEHIALLGLVKTIEIEADRINNSGLLAVHFSAEGGEYSLGEQNELVLFRIFQEALNNTLKHAQAKHLKIGLQYHPELFNLTLEDDGAGFSAELLNSQSGSGLRNMQNRATLIGAAAIIKSAPGKGCCITVTLNPLKLRVYTDGTHPDRFS